MEQAIATIMRQNIDLIKAREFDSLYLIFADIARESEETQSMVTTATQMFFDMGINPIIYFKEEIPEAFAFNLELPEAVVVIPYPVREIGDDAFTDANFEALKLPMSISSIGQYALAYCRVLKEVHYPGTYAEWKRLHKGYGWANQSHFTLFCSDWAVDVNSGKEKIL